MRLEHVWTMFKAGALQNQVTALLLKPRLRPRLVNSLNPEEPSFATAKGFIENHWQLNLLFRIHIKAIG